MNKKRDADVARNLRVKMVWGLLAVVFILVIVLIYILTRTGTIYWSTDSGFRAITSGEPVPVHRGSLADVKRLIPLLIEGERFDSLFVASGPEDQDCITVSARDGEVALSMAFLVAAEQREEDRARQAFKDLGLELSLDQAWNEGMGTDLESRTLECKLPPEVERVSDVVVSLIERLFPAETRGVVFLSASHTDDGPPESGIAWRPTVDRLDGLMKE